MTSVSSTGPEMALAATTARLLYTNPRKTPSSQAGLPKAHSTSSAKAAAEKISRASQSSRSAGKTVTTHAVTPIKLQTIDERHFGLTASDWHQPTASGKVAFNFALLAWPADRAC